jgi:hypothetical protein
MNDNVRKTNVSSIKALCFSFSAARYLKAASGANPETGYQRQHAHLHWSLLTRQRLHRTRNYQPLLPFRLLHLFPKTKVPKLNTLHLAEPLEPARLCLRRVPCRWAIDVRLSIGLTSHFILVQEVIRRRVYLAVEFRVDGRGGLVFGHGGYRDIRERSKLFKLFVVGGVNFMSGFRLGCPRGKCQLWEAGLAGRTDNWATFSQENKDRRGLAEARKTRPCAQRRSGKGNQRKRTTDHDHVQATDDKTQEPRSLFKLVNVLAENGTGNPTLNDAENTEAV